MRPRNLLLISLDTLRFDAISAAPDRRLLGDDAALARTPTLDRIVSEGTFFARAVTTCPYTSTSHASILTGTYWPKHGVLDLFAYPMRAEAEPLAEALGRRGWRTAQNAGRDRGDGDMFAKDTVGLNRGYGFQAFGGWWKRRTWRWLAEAMGGGPWFLFWHTMAVHRPYGSSHRVFRRLVRKDLAEGTPFENLRKLYLSNISRTDEALGLVWERLRLAGALDDTLVVIMSDHGEGLSVHGTIHNNTAGWQEGVCRVPIIFWRPGCVAQGRVVHEPISTVDVAPTVADLLGLDWEPALGFDGHSVAPVVRGEQEGLGAARHDCFFFASMSDGPDVPPLMQGVVRGSDKYVSFTQATADQWAALERECRECEGDRKKQSRWYNTVGLLERRARGELELLFDTSADPGDLNNLAGREPAKLAELRAAIQGWHERHRPGASAERKVMDAAEAQDVQRRLAQLGYLE